MATLRLREVPVPHESSPGVCWIHPHALVESTALGPGTRVWAFAHVMEGAIVGADCNLGDHCFVERGARLGDRVTLKNGVCVWSGVVLEADVFVGPGVAFTNDLRPRAFLHRPPAQLSATWVGPGATLGAHATILCGLRVGAGAFVAAGAVVTRDVADFALMMGVPARRKAWVCICAARLEEGPPGRWSCPCCRRRYLMDGGVVRPVAASPM